MPILKGTLLLLSVFIYIFIGLFVHLFTFFVLNIRLRIMSDLTKRLSSFIRTVLCIKLHIEGERSYFKERGNFIVSNHLGYLDGIILSGLFPVIFVTKLQVKSWPIFGWMSRAGCTIYIDRKRKLGSMDFVAEISNALKNKANVLFFPECTSSDGSEILPFHQGYFQAALNSGSSVIPVTIQYTKVSSENISLANRDRVFWYGQVKFPRHLMGVLKEKGMEAKAVIHPKIETSAYDPTQAASRKEISESSLQAIAADFSPIK